MAIVPKAIPYWSFDWHWFNNYWCGVSFHVLLLFYTLWVQFTSWNWLLETWPCLEFFCDDLPQDIPWVQVSFKALLDLWLLRALLYGFCFMASLLAQSTCNAGDLQEIRVWSLGQEDPLVQEIAPHSNILAWETPWTEEPGRLQSMGSHRVRHDWVTKQQKHLF